MQATGRIVAERHLPNSVREIVTEVNTYSMSVLSRRLPGKHRCGIAEG